MLLSGWREREGERKGENGEGKKTGILKKKKKIRKIELKRRIDFPSRKRD